MKVNLMKKILLSTVAFSLILLADSAIVPGDEHYYQTDLEGSNTTFIYSDSGKYLAEEFAKREEELHKEYEHYFGFKLDDTMYSTFSSDRNQVANSFAGSAPFVVQELYQGGAELTDYFTVKNWAALVMYHETAHNYQFNPKASIISRGMHTVFGNNPLPLAPLPIFVMPNAMIPSFIAEGNAVLNESWHGNGGRLYNGYLKAMTIEQAKAGNINPSFLFNQNTYDFPVGERTYILGGFFQYYLVKTYGLQKTDQFFFNHSKSWLWPFRTNHIFEMTFGVNFEQAISDYNKWLLAEGEGFVEAKGEPIATSTFFYQLGDNGDKIYFNINDGFNAPERVILLKNDKSVDFDRDNFNPGRMVNHNHEYYTMGSGHIDPWHISQGLFDHDGMQLDGSDSKLIFGYLKNDVPVYFNAKTSGVEPQLYVGDEFYAVANSSVYIDKKENLYYFKQQGKERTLYKNKKPFYTFKSFYGFPIGVDTQERVYFVTNSEKGSSVYRVDASGDAQRVSDADNVVDARLINDSELLVAAINGEEYYYVVNKMTTQSQTPPEYCLTLEDEEYYTSPLSLDKGSQLPTKALPTDEGYYSELNLKYSSSSLSIANADNNKGEQVFTYNATATFIDPAMTNTMTLFVKNGVDEIGLYGGTYDSTRHIIQYGGSLYGTFGSGKDNTYSLYNENNNTYDKENDHNISVDSRDFGFNIYATLPVYSHGYRHADFSVNYYQDYDTNARSPLVGQAKIYQLEGNALGVAPTFLQLFNVFGTYDRSDLSIGAKYKFSTALPWKFYAGMQLNGVRTDFDNNGGTAPNEKDFTKGVKFTPFQNDVVTDPSVVVMKNLYDTRFVKQALVGGLNLKKQFDGRLLFFTFPLSLIRETVYCEYNHFDIQDFGQSTDNFSTHTVYNEYTAGVTFDLLLLNNLSIPVGLEYTHNDNTDNSDNFGIVLKSLF